MAERKRRTLIAKMGWRKDNGANHLPHREEEDYDEGEVNEGRLDADKSHKGI